MEAIVALTVLVLFAALAARFGHDSRDGIRTKEYDLAASGMTWSRSDDPPPRPSRADVRRSHQPIAVVATRLSGEVRSVDAVSGTT